MLDLRQFHIDRSLSDIHDLSNQNWATHDAVHHNLKNATLAKKLGANVYIDSKATIAAEELQKLGGARWYSRRLQARKPCPSWSTVWDRMESSWWSAPRSTIEVTPVQLISGSRTIRGWASGTPADSEDTLRLAELSGVRPMIETYPLEEAAEAYARMVSGKAEFRVVLTM
jgi:D-arabinose 1-dehydrogenase-like Zn-dependent alcohol dehydrogenase